VKARKQTTLQNQKRSLV